MLAERVACPRNPKPHSQLANPSVGLALIRREATRRGWQGNAVSPRWYPSLSMLLLMPSSRESAMLLLLLVLLLLLRLPKRARCAHDQPRHGVPSGGGKDGSREVWASNGAWTACWLVCILVCGQVCVTAPRSPPHSCARISIATLASLEMRP